MLIVWHYTYSLAIHNFPTNRTENALTNTRTQSFNALNAVTGHRCSSEAENTRSAHLLAFVRRNDTHVKHQKKKQIAAPFTCHLCCIDVHSADAYHLLVFQIVLEPCFIVAFAACTAFFRIHAEDEDEEKQKQQTDRIHSRFFPFPFLCHYYYYSFPKNFVTSSALCWKCITNCLWIAH